MPSSLPVAGSDQSVDVRQYDVEAEVEEIDIADGDGGFAGDHGAALATGTIFPRAPASTEY
jgi:hypothetical protein